MENIGDFLLKILRLLVELPTKLYEMLNYEVSIKWLSKIFEFFGTDIGLPENISLIGVLGTVSAVTLVIMIIYNIFKW